MFGTRSPSVFGLAVAAVLYEAGNWVFDCVRAIAMVAFGDAGSSYSLCLISQFLFQEKDLKRSDPKTFDLSVLSGPVTRLIDR